MEPTYIASLNTAQRRAVLHDVEEPGPLLVIAGAGSGKTKTLAHRVAHLIAQGVDPSRLLLLTFTRRAANELISRAQAIAEGAMNTRAMAFPWAGTFHSVGSRVLRDYADQLGINRNFTILDREDSADLLDLTRHDLDLHLVHKRFPQKGTCLAIYSRIINGNLPIDHVLSESFPWCLEFAAELQELFSRYVTAKQTNGSFDFDDLLEYWNQAMLVPEIAEDLSSRFDHILVDEYQDTNTLQAGILMNLRPSGRGVVVVGDDAQSIYRFRSANVENILQFPATYSPPAEVITLDRNYRSSSPILTASNAVIGAAKSRFTKDLWTERQSDQKPLLVAVEDAAEQARYIAEKVLDHREAGATLRQQAVLFRTTHHSAVLELELTRRGIPYVMYGGLRFLDAKHIKDVFAIIRFAENPRDKVAAFRVLQLLPGVGPRVAGRAYDLISGYAAPLQKLAEFKVPAAAAPLWSSLSDLMVGLSTTSKWPADIDRVRAWYTPLLEDEFDDAASRLADITQLCSVAAGYPTRTRFLNDLTLDPPDATSDEAADPSLDEDYLTLSTVHSAKGREWKAVFILNTIDGSFPSDLGVGSEDEIEEERRLLYVGMTRAKDHLALLLPMKWYVHRQPSYGDRHVNASRTRFITDDMLPHFEQVTWSSLSHLARKSVVLPPRIADLNARVRDRWK